jgi:hypothetical protein
VTTKPKGKTQAELDEDDALQLAISLSQREAEEKERQKKQLTQHYAMSTLLSPPTPLGSAPIADQVSRLCLDFLFLSTKINID